MKLRSTILPVIALAATCAGGTNLLKSPPTPEQITVSAAPLGRDREETRTQIGNTLKEDSAPPVRPLDSADPEEEKFSTVADDVVVELAAYGGSWDFVEKDGSSHVSFISSTNPNKRVVFSYADEGTLSGHKAKTSPKPKGEGFYPVIIERLDRVEGGWQRREEDTYITWVNSTKALTKIAEENAVALEDEDAGE